MTALDDVPDLLTVEEYASWARRGRNQAYGDVRRGDVPSLRLGRAIRIPKHLLLAMTSPNGDGPAGTGPSDESSSVAGEGARRAV